MTNHYYEDAYQDAGRLKYVRADVPGWKDMYSVQAAEADLIGLKENGTLISYVDGVLAKNIKKYFVAECWGSEGYDKVITLEVIAITEDGTVFSTVDSLMKDLADWTDLVDITMMLKEDGTYAAMAVNSENQLLKYNCDPECDTLPEEDVAFVMYAAKEFCVITRSAEIYEPGDSKSYRDEAFFFDGNAYEFDHEGTKAGIGPYFPTEE